MQCETNDPRLTAYALGELDQPERGKIEQHLAVCAVCRQEVERIGELAAALSRELEQEPLPIADVRPIKLASRRPRKVLFGGLAAAACILVVGSAGFYVVTSSHSRFSALSGALEIETLPETEHGGNPQLQFGADSASSNLLASGEIKASGAGRSANFHAPSSPIGPSPGLVTKSGPQPGQANSPVYPVADLVIPIRQVPATVGGVSPRTAGKDAPGLTPSQLETETMTLTGTTGPGFQMFTGTFSGTGPAPGPRTVITSAGGRPAPWRATNDVQYFPPQGRNSPKPMPPPRVPGAVLEKEFNTEAYDRVVDNPFLEVRQNPLSTFSIDVDTASYAIVRRFLMQGNLRPPPDSVRIEELVNYFSYDYAPPQDDAPFAAQIEAADCPWQPAHRLVRIGLKGRVIADDKRPASNLVFLLDVSGSMEPANKLPLVRQAMTMLVRKLGDRDRVAIAVYAGASGLVLPSTSCEQKETILAALDRLQAGGSTNGGQGIQLAYQLARQNFVHGGTNRVILCTDGDFNVGITNRGDLTRLIEKEAAGGVFLTVLGFGMGNYKDATLEQLADKGNGNYGYVDSPAEARKLLVDQLGGTLVTIAKDVKIQVEFNPRHAVSYRLLGYENRMLRKEDFNNDKKDAGEIGAGHTVTALYEVVPAGLASGTPAVDPLKYQPPPKPAQAAADATGELLTLKLRYKQPEGQTSTLVEHPFTDAGKKWADSSRDFRFAAAVAAFGMLLRESPYKGSATLDSIHEWAVEGRGADLQGYRSEFMTLLERAKTLMK